MGFGGGAGGCVAAGFGPEAPLKAPDEGVAGAGEGAAGRLGGTHATPPGTAWSRMWRKASAPRGEIVRVS